MVLLLLLLLLSDVDYSVGAENYKI